MAVCDYIIEKDITVNCDDPITPGVEAEGVIMNRSDIDFAASQFSPERNNVIETLALKTGKKAFKVVQGGNAPFTGTQTALATGTYRNSFTHTVSLVVQDNDPDVTRQIIDGLANGSFVVILENNYKALNKDVNKGDAAFQIYGWYNGLKATEITSEKYSEDTDGGWLVNLEETKAPKSGLFLYKTSLEMTKAAVNSLLSPSE